MIYYNGNKYPLTPELTISVGIDGKERHFSIKEYGIEIDYPESEFIGVDEFSEEEDITEISKPRKKPWNIIWWILEADGILRVSKGDTVEGVFEATMGAIGTGAVLSSVYALKGAKAIDDIDSYADLMSLEDAKKYLEFLENGSTAGLTSEELAGIDKLDELLALEKVEWDDVVRIRADVYEGRRPSKIQH